MNRMVRQHVNRGIGSALSTYADQLRRGDPTAVGFTVFAALLLLSVVAIWLADRRNRTATSRPSRR